MKTCSYTDAAPPVVNKIMMMMEKQMKAFTFRRLPVASLLSVASKYYTHVGHVLCKQTLNNGGRFLTFV